MSISVIIPSYKNPKYLDLCIKSALETQTQKNEIIVVLDGYPDISKDTLKKYENDILVLDFDENQGMAKAINYGVYNATGDWVLIASEDNVFCDMWDRHLNDYIINGHTRDYVVTIQQIEPVGPSIYKMNIYDFGKTVEEFNFPKFKMEEQQLFRKSVALRDTEDGGTFPFMISKKNFMKVGGFDIDYPSPFVVDWDFFLKCELSDLTLVRTHRLNFYHFVSKSTKNRDGYIEEPNEKNKFFHGERNAAQYFQYKWGFPPHRDENNKCKSFINF